MKYYIIAGEASGDLHGSNLIKALKQKDPQADIRCWGGDLMKDAGAELVKHYKDLAFMGFAEVIKNLPTILSNLKFCKADITSFKPDVVIFIDYPGFNLRIAKWARENGFKTIYYISPQVWAWKQSRVKLIKQVVDRMLVILPFEKEFYDQWDYKVTYVGHPLAEVVDESLKMPTTELVTTRPGKDVEKGRSIDQVKEKIALLPGSRLQEIKVKLPVMLQATKNFAAEQFVVAQAPSQPIEVYMQMIRPYPNVQVAFSGQTYSLLKQSKAALVTSGTATLETALFGVPQVVCYKGSWVSYQIAKRLVKVKYISLVNLIMDKEVVKELIQDDLTVTNVTTELNRILHDEKEIARMKKDYSDLKALLHQQQPASSRAAEEIINFLSV